jgi:hypothetical protein
MIQSDMNVETSSLWNSGDSEKKNLLQILSHTTSLSTATELWITLYTSGIFERTILFIEMLINNENTNKIQKTMFEYW